MPNQQRICIVICYFGHWPSWFDLYLESCRYNPSIDFLIFSDCGATNISCENVKIIDSTLEQFNAQASACLGLPVSVKDPYKLCDFKPAFGVIFADYLVEYDFWGNADIDLIYGNIRSFLTEQVLTEHDVISARSEYLAGHLTLYRNRPEINRLYEKSADYPRVFLHAEHLSFCECSRMWHHLHNGGSIFDEDIYLDKWSSKKEKPETDSMTHIVKRLEKEGKLRAYFKTMIKDRPELQEWNWELCWERGRLRDTNTGDESLYFHMIGQKGHPEFKIPEWEQIPDRYFINRRGFSLHSQLNENIIQRFLNKLSALRAHFQGDNLPY